MCDVTIHSSSFGLVPRAAASLNSLPSKTIGTIKVFDLRWGVYHFNDDGDKRSLSAFEL